MKKQPKLQGMSRKKAGAIILLLMICLLTGCAKWGNKIEKPANPTMDASRGADLIGYVTKKDEKRILVVSNIKRVTSGVKEYYDAVWVSEASKEIEVGERVEVWFKGEIATSYPAQGGASKVKVVPSVRHEGAVLSEAQAIKKAILANPEIKVFVVNQLDFDPKLKQWTILYKDGFISSEELKQLSYQFEDSLME